MAWRQRVAMSPLLWVVSVVVAQSPDLTFHADTHEVLVDTAVFDKKGNFERDLTRRDFRLWEDGKEQKITSFSLESERPEHRNQHFVSLVFDTEWPGLRDEVTQFVDRFAAPNLHIAIFSRVEHQMILQQAFTEDAEQIKIALRTMKVTTGKPMEGITPGHNPVFDRVSSAVIALAPTRGRKALILFSIGFLGYRSGAELFNGEYRRYNGLPLGTSWLARTVGICNAANVSVYSFANGKDAGVSKDYYTRPQDPALDVGGATDFIRDLAVATGGKYMPPGKYDLAAYLREVSQDPSEYYLLGYEPSTRSRDDDPCHTLKVKVVRKGLRVSARDSYCSE